MRHDKVTLPDGTETIREVVEHPGGVAIAALTDQNELLLVDQFRYAQQRIMREVPAGKREPGEDPLVTAQRELQEETGYIIKKVTQGCEYGNTGQHAALYVAADNRIDDTA